MENWFLFIFLFFCFFFLATLSDMLHWLPLFRTCDESLVVAYACLQPSCYKAVMMTHCQEKGSWADTDLMAAEKSRVGRGREKKVLWGLWQEEVMMRRKRKIWPVPWCESLEPCRSLVCLLSPCGRCHTELLAVSIAPSPPTPPFSGGDGTECLFLRLASNLGSTCRALLCCRNLCCHLLWDFLARDFQSGVSSENSVFLDCVSAKKSDTDIVTIAGCPSTCLYRIPSVEQSVLTTDCWLQVDHFCP